MKKFFSCVGTYPCDLTCHHLQVKLTGPADPERLTATGEILFEGGNLNLVATQFALDR